MILVQGEEALELFKRCSPPVYDGSLQEYALMEFLNSTLQFFKCMWIVPSEIVTLAVAQPEGTAALWWKSKNLDAANTTWAYFVEAITDHFDRQVKTRCFSERVSSWSYEPGE